jgi:hypothetical protein
MNKFKTMNSKSYRDNDKIDTEEDYLTNITTTLSLD